MGYGGNFCFNSNAEQCDGVTIACLPVPEDIFLFSSAGDDVPSTMREDNSERGDRLLDILIVN